MGLRARCFQLVALSLIAGCEGKDRSAGNGTTPVFAMYGPRASTRLTPFPSDRYTKVDASTATGLRLDLRSETTIDRVITAYPKTVADMNALDGFSTVGGFFVNFSEDIDFATVKRPLDGYHASDSPLALVDVDDASPEKGQARGLLPLYYSTADKEFDYTSEEHSLTAQPDRPLRPKTKYLFVATRAIKTKAGAPVQPTEETRALLTGTINDGYSEKVRAALPTLEKATGITRDSIVVASLFTTQSVHEEVLAMAKERRAAPPPKQIGELTVVETGKAPDNRVRFAGKFEAPEYRSPKSPTDPTSGKWQIKDGKPTVQSTVQLEFLLAFADATKKGPKPIAIFGHGLGGTKEGVWGTAERLKDLDVAVFSIDAPEHGSRGAAKDMANPLGATLSFFGIDSQTKDEGFVIGRARDNFRQMAADQLELIRFIQSLSTLDVLPVGAPDGVPDLDVTKIVYLGHSFGSVMGPTIAAIAPEIRAACWNVGGAGLMTLLRDSSTFKILIDALRPVGTPQGEVARFFTVTQAIVDRGDPINFARFVTMEALPGIDGWKARDVLLQEVFNDTIVPNSTSEMIARAAGLVHVLPKVSDIPGVSTAAGPIKSNLPSGATAAIAQFERGADGKLIDHGSLIFAAEGRAQYVPFFAGALGGGHATIESPFPGGTSPSGGK